MERTTYELRSPLGRRAGADQRGSEQSPVFVKQVPSLDANNVAKRQEERESDKAANDRLMAYATVALAFITLGLAIYTAKLWKATVALGKEAKETAERQATDTDRALGIAQQSSDAAKSASESASKQVRVAVVSSMPILVPFVIEGAAGLYPEKLITEPYTPKLKFVFQNFGTTPGIVWHARAKMFLVTQDRDLPEVDFNKLPVVFAQIIVPGKLYGNHARIPGSSVECPPHEPITPEQHSLLLSETKVGETPVKFQRFYLFCQVVYDDFFGMRHTATFCMKVRRGGYHGQHGGRKYNRITSEPIPEDEGARDE